MRSLGFGLLIIALSACTIPSKDFDPPLTRAESSGFTETSRYAEVIEFLATCAQNSDLVRLDSFGATAEGRTLPLAVLGDPPPKDPSEIDRSRTMVVYVNANIHAGEVAGKEACLMLIRQIATGELASLLKDTVLLICPIYNADGNERIDVNNRSWQKGPEKGVGIRTNAQSLDLNRDMMKLESLEAQSLVRNVLVRWDPHLVVDCHTTNGSFHREPITYAPPHTPMAHAALLDYHTGVMLPWIAKRTLERDRFASIPYGNFKDAMNPEQGWSTFDHKPRYVSNYVSLRNQLSILIEMYAYAEYEERVKACRAFLQSIVEFAAANGEAMRRVKAQAEKTPLERFHLSFAAQAYEEPITIQGYRMEMTENESGRKRARPLLDQPVNYVVPYFGKFTATDDGLPLPESYLFPRGLIELKEKLDQQGIVMEEITQPFTAKASVFDIEKIEVSERLYQGHRLQTLTGAWVEKNVSFPAGAYRVPVAQPLGRLAAYLLEPQSDDGLACWNGLDRYLNRGVWDTRPGTFPVVRLMAD
jgi:hypothetical protein